MECSNHFSPRSRSRHSSLGRILSICLLDSSAVQASSSILQVDLLCRLILRPALVPSLDQDYQGQGCHQGCSHSSSNSSNILSLISKHPVSHQHLVRQHCSFSSHVCGMSCHSLSVVLISLIFLLVRRYRIFLDHWICMHMRSALRSIE